MFQVARWRVMMVAILTVLGILFALPNVLPQSTLNALPGWIPAKKLNLGLDLRGGSYLQLEADVDQLKRERMTNLMEDIRSSLNAGGIGYTGPTASGESVSVTLNSASDQDAAYRLISAMSSPVGGSGLTDLAVVRQGDIGITATFRAEAIDAIVSEAVGQSIEVVRRRVDPDGNKEVSITKQGIDRIVVQAPGDSDPAALVSRIDQTARLTFQMVDENASVAEAVATGFVPPGDVLVPYAVQNDPQGGGSYEVVRRRAIVTGEMLTSASLQSQQGQWVVGFRFNGEGGRRFADITSQNVGKRFAILLDGKVISAPVIRSAITGGSGIIEGGFTAASANELVVLLKAGALPVKLNVLEQRAVTAELGADAVAAGQTATLIAFLAVLVFMVLAYGFLFGGISIAALTINGAMLIAIMSLFQATLTLPGIAGLILTLAMAVDANVLIYERMRDEIRFGKNVISSMEAGFGKAMVTILDANLTTLIAAVMMFLFGEGPVKGFAWTLTIGLFTSVFTAVFVTQVLLAFWFRAARPKTLPIAS